MLDCVCDEFGYLVYYVVLFWFDFCCCGYCVVE